MIWVGEKSDDPLLDSDEEEDSEEEGMLTHGDVQKLWKPG